MGGDRGSKGGEEEGGAGNILRVRYFIMLDSPHGCEIILLYSNSHECLCVDTVRIVGVAYVGQSALFQANVA